MFGFLKTRRRRKEARREARDVLASLASASSPGDGERALDALRTLAASGVVPEPEMHSAFVAAYILYSDASIRDDLLNEPEAGVLSGIWREIEPLRPRDLEGGDLTRAINRVQACLINTNGPMPVPSSLGGDGETVYWSGDVQLMRQKRSFRGHGPSISLPLGHGVRFRWSEFEGAPAYSMEYTAVDTGTFAVTTDELLFLGAHNTIRTRLRDVLAIDLLADGFRVHSSRRERVDMFQTVDAPVVAATIQWLLAHDAVTS